MSGTWGWGEFTMNLDAETYALDCIGRLTLSVLQTKEMNYGVDTTGDKHWPNPIKKRWVPATDGCGTNGASTGSGNSLPDGNGHVPPPREASQKAHGYHEFIHDIAGKFKTLKKGILRMKLNSEGLKRMPKRLRNQMRGIEWHELLKPEYAVRSTFWKKVKEELKKASTSTSWDSQVDEPAIAEVAVEDKEDRPLSTSTKDLWEAYRAAGAPPPLSSEELVQMGFRKEVVGSKRSELELDTWWWAHRNFCSICQEQPVDEGPHGDCYFKELLLCLERGFTLPLKSGVSEGKVQPRQGREIKTRDPADLELLTDRKKEDAWEARVKLDDTPFAADDVWVAPAFVAKKRIFQHCDFREPRVVTGFNESINDFLVTPSFALITAGDIIQEISQDDMVGALDLASAFLQVPMAPEHWKYLGVRCDPKNPDHVELYRKLPFGLSVAPLIFCIFSSEVASACRGFGLRVWSYFDDFMIIVDRSEAERSFNEFQELLSSMGLYFKPSKLQLPSRKCTILGVTVDLEAGLVALKDGYIESLCAILEQTKHQKPTVSELRSLIGRLNYVSLVIPEGRLRMNGLYSALFVGRDITARRRRTISRGVGPTLRKVGQSRVFNLWGNKAPWRTRRDMNWWWKKCVETCNMLEAHEQRGKGLASKREYQLTSPLRCELREEFINSDASLDLAAAALHDNELYWVWKDHFPDLFANTCDAELLGALLPVLVNPRRFVGACVICCVDNAGTCFVINSLRCKRENAAVLLKKIANLQAEYGFLVTAQWVPREANKAADFWTRVDPLAKPDPDYETVWMYDANDVFCRSEAEDEEYIGRITEKECKRLVREGATASRSASQHSDPEKGR